MKLVLKFKDGMLFTQDLTEFQNLLDTQQEGSNILGYFVKGKNNNGTITLNHEGEQIIRNFNDLYSIEIIFE